MRQDGRSELLDALTAIFGAATLAAVGIAALVVGAIISADLWAAVLNVIAR